MVCETGRKRQKFLLCVPDLCDETETMQSTTKICFVYTLHFFVGVMMNYFLSSFHSGKVLLHCIQNRTGSSFFLDCLPVQNKQILDGNTEDRQ